ncbi:hypothetical protein [Solitalea canadensis]|uniref:Uncharacterized protein n=1 Tax=Solitalea canadensis (strain ATCC 29591 / DSM 3403 / JCM 21819 / LMG 8368 / NBRC 15130 / NCIMB 12057 / USAM 9D) TaxID=929556 RepID=H8KN30_SOLCM|nr:hypothetical protein [Solitalea canadensis]AFD09109.1 hypothetical protein Solca_4119 [Solitalea canadensis DSM 3403]
MITKAIQNAFNTAQRKNWDHTYWAFDIHGTIVYPNYSATKIPTTFYPYAKECLQLISGRKDVVMILYTCSYPHEIEQYLKFFKEQGIHFRFVNQNPEVVNEAYGFYEQKFYFNVLFEDKSGFDPEQDWEKIYTMLKNNKTEACILPEMPAFIN